MTTKVDEATSSALVAECKTPQDETALYTQMLQRVISRDLSAKLDVHLHSSRSKRQVAHDGFPRTDVVIATLLVTDDRQTRCG